SLGPLRSRRLRRRRSSSVANGSLRRSISWPAIARAFAALSVRTPARGRSALIFVADDVGGIVILRLHHVEYHRLRLTAGGAPNSGHPGWRLHVLAPFLRRLARHRRTRRVFHLQPIRRAPGAVP